MSTSVTTASPPEHNVTGIDFHERTHFRYTGPPLIDFHAHVFQTRPGDPADGPPLGTGPGASLASAETMFDVARMIASRMPCISSRISKTRSV